MSELEIQQADQVFTVVVELSRVPDHRRLPALRVDRIAAQPAQRELQQRIRGDLRFAVGAFVFEHAGHARGGSIGGVKNARVDEGADVECMQARKRMQIFVDDPPTGRVGDALEVLLTRQPVHHVEAGIVRPQMDLGDRDARIVQQALERHLMVKSERHQCVDALAADAHLVLLAVTLDRGEPCGPPSGLLLDVQNPAQVLVQDASDDVGGELSHAVSLVLTAESQSGVARAEDVGGHDRPELVCIPALLAVRDRGDGVPALEQLKILTERADDLTADMAGLRAGQPGHHG